MKHNIGDVVRIKSKEWYEKNRDEDGRLRIDTWIFFISKMAIYCGDIATITNIHETLGEYNNIVYLYDIDKDGGRYDWTDEMFEDSIEEPLPEGVGIAVPLSPVKVIDWEQRHYEISKDALQVIMSSSEYGIGHHTETAARFAIQMADELVKQLKEREGKK